MDALLINELRRQVQRVGEILASVECLNSDYRVVSALVFDDDQILLRVFTAGDWSDNAEEIVLPLGWLSLPDDAVRAGAQAMRDERERVHAERCKADRLRDYLRLKAEFEKEPR